MELFPNLKKIVERRRQKSRVDKEIKRVLRELKKIDSNQHMNEDMKIINKKYIITLLAKRIEKGSIKFEDIDKKESLEIIDKIFQQTYPKIGEVTREIRFDKMMDIMNEKLQVLLVRFRGTEEDSKDYEDIESVALEFYSRYPDDTSRNLNIKPLSNLEIYNLICSYLKKGLGEGEFCESALKRIRVLTENKMIGKINGNKDMKEQERIYNEYVGDFLGGIETRESNVVSYFQKSDFIQRKNRKKECEELGVKYEDEPLIIYKGEKSKLKYLEEENRRRAKERLNTSVTTSDLVLVRTTNVFPKEGIVEVLDKHSMPELQESPFRRELEDAGLKMEDFQIYSFMSRRTSHWTLNGLVSSHMYGNFEGRNFIIVEPFEEQVNNDGLLNIDEADTYFEGDLKLSKKAIVLMKLEEYIERYKDPIKRAEMKKMNIRLFTGDENIAVKMLLQDLGYVYENVGMWGYDLDTNTPELEYARKLEKVMGNETQRLQQEGKKIKPVTHMYSDSIQLDIKRNAELELERINMFVDMLKENTDVNFSPKYLKRILLNREQWKNDDEDHYLDRDVVEPKGLIRMSPKEILAQIGPEKLKEITQMFNEKVLEEHRKARAQKDKQLEKGLLVEM